MITNLYIDSILYNLIPNVYMGCWSCDNIPVKKCVKNGNFCVIVNLSPAGTQGSHFISISKLKNKVIVFDPLYHHLSWLPLPIKKFINKISNMLVWTPYKQPIQCASTSTYCGFFTMAEVLQTFVKTSGLKSYKKRRLKLNDGICIKNIAQIISSMK